VKVLANHLGFETGAPGSAVIEGADPSAAAPASCAVVDGRTGTEVFRTTCEPAATVAAWKGWTFRRVDLPGFDRPGLWRLRARVGADTAESEAFEIGEHLVPRRSLSAVLSYFKAQRASGAHDRADRAVPFHGGRPGTVDVHGGWYDASGDMSKYLTHLSYANTMNPQQSPAVVWCLLEGLARLRGTDPRLAAALESRVVDEALHGADFLVRMQDPEGYFYTAVFDGWSHDPRRRLICSFSTQKGVLSADYRAGFRQGGGAAVAALARAAGVSARGEHSPEDYRAAAEQGFRHLELHSRDYLPDRTENIIDDYCALLAATELAALTGSDVYRRAAEARARSMAARVSADDNFTGWWRTDDAGGQPFFHAAEEGLPVLALVRFLEVLPGSAAAAAAVDAVRASLRFSLAVTGEVPNPFGYARQYGTPSGGGRRSAFFMPHANPTGYWWQGENARLASLAAAARAARSLTGATEKAMAPALRRYAADQLDWILGRNPFDACMLHGFGRNNPEYEWGWFNAPGGIVNGITAGFRDEQDIDFLPDEVAADGMHRWRWSEQWLPHAAWFFLAACLPA
jgi:hypothetical protein